MIELFSIIFIAVLAAFMEYRVEKNKNLTEFDLKRIEDNEEILKLIKKYMKDNPQQRFGQVLKNLGVLERELVQKRGMEDWESGELYISNNLVHDEPEIILERIKKALDEQKNA